MRQLTQDDGNIFGRQMGFVCEHLWWSQQHFRCGDVSHCKEQSRARSVYLAFRHARQRVDKDVLINDSIVKRLQQSTVVSRLLLFGYRLTSAEMLAPFVIEVDIVQLDILHSQQSTAIVWKRLISRGATQYCSPRVLYFLVV